MRKILAALLLLPALVHAATWYVRPTGQTYGNSSGTSYANAWTAYNGIVWGSVAAGDTLFICGTWLDTLYMNLAGANGNPITFSGACPGDPAVFSGVGAGITDTGFNFWTVKNFTLNKSSGISCFACSTANGGSCSGREGNCDGWTVSDNTFNAPQAVAIQISTVANQTTYPATLNLQILRNKITNAQKHGISIAGSFSNAIIDSNTVNGANLDHTSSAWGIYVTTRWFVPSGASWTTVGTCAAGGKNLYKITMTTAGAGANEVATQVIHNNDLNGHYTSTAGCANDGAAAAMATQTFCQNAAASPVYQCGPAPADATLITSANANPGYVVSNNEVTNADNFNGTQDGVGIGADWGSTHGVFARNYAHDNQGRGLELNYPTANLETRANLATNNGLWGFNYGGIAPAANTLRLFNNVASGNGAAAYRVSTSPATGLNWQNNIAANSPSCMNFPPATDVNNFIFNCTNTGFSSPLTGNPGWVGGPRPTAIAGFRLTATSPLFAAGALAGHYADYAGRLFRDPPSIGAFERASGDSAGVRQAAIARPAAAARATPAPRPLR